MLAYLEMKIKGNKSMPTKAEDIGRSVRYRSASPVRMVRLHCQTRVLPVNSTPVAPLLKRRRRNTSEMSMQMERSLWRGTSKELVKRTKGHLHVLNVSNASTWEPLRVARPMGSDPP